MAARRQTSGKKSGRDMVEINVTGNNNAVSTHGGKATVSITQAAQDDWKAWREKMENEIRSLRTLPAEDQTMLVQNVDQVVQEAEKGKQADPSRIERLLNSIATMAPDILDVLVTTIANPLAGIGLVVKKIGEKASVIRKS
jgi:hypothetical protein